MAKTNITLYSSTPSSNTDINNINIDENCPASGLNNAIRELMAHLKNVDTGSQALTALSVTGNVSVGGTFTSTGIDDNADATAITIDSTERVLINKTSTNFGVEGVELGGADGKIFITRDNNSLYLNRLSSDGNIVQFYKDSTEVGSIGTQGSRLSIGSGDVNLNFNASANSIYPISDPAAGTLFDNAVDLGAALSRWKDLYLSGGVYLGGTGSANFLDDYEEGTYEPTFTGSSAGTLTLQTTYRTLAYTKIGRQVTITGRIRNAASGTISGALQISLPFATASLTQEADIFSGSVLVRDLDVPTNTFDLNVLGEGGTSVIEVYASIDNGVWHDIDANDSPQNAYYVFGFSYFTDS